MILFIDTSIPEKTKIVLMSPSGQKIDSKIWSSFANQSEELLGEVDLLLSNNQKNKKDLEGILVNTGPGSYTGLRVGITTANFLGLSQNIPIVAIKNDDQIEESISKLKALVVYKSPVLPSYQNEPKITQPKARQ